jgi:hypothetical protein
MLKGFFIPVIVLLFITGCEKQEEFVKVSYRVSQAYSPVEISYLNPRGDLEKVSYDFESIQDVWQTNFEIPKGEIVYLSVVYHDSVSSVKAQIMAGGKVFKEASSVQKPGIDITVSGVIPY